jgi:predicted amidohydrolase
MRITILKISILVWVVLLGGQGLADPPVSDENTTIRVAIFQMSPEEGNFSANHATIEEAINISSDMGADWFMTPELAESGYEFVDYIRPEELPEFPSPWFNKLRQMSREKNITLFIGFPEHSDGEYFNAVAVIDREGIISGVHQKTDIIPSKYEEWAEPGTATSLSADGQTVGYYICADVVNQDITDAYLADGADILLSSAAWYPDPSMGPEEYWKNVTEMAGIPLIIANTAGKKGKIDYTGSISGVYRDGEIRYRIPGSDQVVAFVDWNPLTGEITPAFEPVPVT